MRHRGNDDEGVQHPDYVGCNDRRGNLREPLTSGDHNVFSYSVTPDGSKAAVLVSTPTNIGDLFLLDGPGHLDRLTHINDELFAKLNLTEPETIWYRSEEHTSELQS